MKSIRIGNDIRIEWPIVLSGDVSKLQDLDLTVEVRPSAKIIDTHNYADEIRNNDNKRLLFEKHETTVMMNGGLECRRDIGDGKEHCRPRPPRPCPPRPIPPAPVKLPYHIEDNTLIAMWTADRQFATGDYDIILYAHKNEGGQAVCDQYRFVRLVSHTAQADAPDDSGIEAVIAMQPVTLELSGLSAYEVAVINGFQGTEEEWLASLKKPAEDAAEELKQEIEQFKEDTKEELQADIKALGYYEDSPEFIRVYTDAEGKFLWGIRTDGSIEWAKGVPTPVQNALKELADKIKDLGGDKIEEVETALNEKIEALQDAIDVINASLKTLTDTFSYQDNPEFVNVVTDAEGKVLFGIKEDGKPYFPKNETYSVESNQEWLAVWLDAAGHVLFGLRTDGSTYVGKSDFLNKIDEIKKLLDDNGIGDSQISEQVKQLQQDVADLQETFSIISNDEWLHAVVDAENRLLFGIRHDGTIYMPKQDTYNIVSNDEWLAAWVDSQDKILFGVKADGTFWAAKHNFNAGKDYDNQIEQINNTLTTIQGTLTSLQETINGLQQGNEAIQMLYVSDNPEYMAVTTDSENKTLSYRSKDGINHENIGFDSIKYYQNGKEKKFAENLTDLEDVSNHNTPNLLIANEMQKTFNDGVNSFTPPNTGYEMSNPIECKAGDWFTRTGTATGMVVVTDDNDRNGTRLFNADGTTLGNTFQIPVDMKWVRYIRMAAEITGAQNGSVVICKGKRAFTEENRGDFLTFDKLKVQSYNLPKDIKYLKSSDGQYWELYVDENHQLQIREIDPDIITELPNDFPVYNLSGDFTKYFDEWVSMVAQYLVARNKNGVIGYEHVEANPALYAEFRRETNSSGEIRYIAGLINSGDKGEKGLTIYDKDFNVIETNIQEGFGYDPHDFVYFDDNHVAIFTVNSAISLDIPVDKDKSEYVNTNVVTESIIEIKKIDGIWKQIGRFDITDYPQLLTDAFGIYSTNETLDSHQNTLFLDYDNNYVFNLRNNDSWIKIKRIENEDGTVTIGSKTKDYNEAIIGRVGGKYNSGYIDPKRVLDEGFSFTDIPSNLHTRSTDEQPEWKWYHAHKVAYWGMKYIGGKDYPTYTLFDNNMWTGNTQAHDYIDINPRNNYVNNPNGNDDGSFNINSSDDGGPYDVNMVSRVVQLSIDWDNHIIKEYKVYVIPKQYSQTRGSAQMFDEGVIFISWADQHICGLYDFNDEQTSVKKQIYENGKELFKCNIGSTWGFYRVHGYKNN